MSLGLEYKIISQYLLDNFKFKIFPSTNSGSLRGNFQSILNDEIYQTKEFRGMSQELKWKTHAYVRRQMTWLRKLPNVVWIKNKNEANKIVKDFLG
jgi:hypothetical protein